MTPPWTGHPGEPVPVELRHRRSGIGSCVDCYRDLAGIEDGLCGVAVARRFAEARVRDEIVRWLRAAVREALALAPTNRRRSFLRAHAETMTKIADAIAAGDAAAWCEAHPETSPAREDTP